ncbi:Crp/Fnr family transcriptional regulator [Cytophagaceae bacterium DM2B3-1]|uniref:Crp/Fnr family transcriptional regulator n=1 Tax=Xanthocytophaga flava TaxID=3048013 RepID=A0ABT7CK38_9BACT|nr:Crp/Fnr family transcriptional regulator [Xanthocytophaga flavus]MDJ1472347.1 Crp/Fnr family transcriptional regulator [Xanthocytophaga flavus]MDJ1493044.1 Crp/Fnr family transcriptional regulator [Xanthocytophaga flavus]
MDHLLLCHITKNVALSVEESEKILSYFNYHEYGKKEHLVLEGQPCKQLYFVIKGSLRMYFTDEKGMEQTIQFAIENWWMTDLMAFQRGGLSEFSIQTIEKTQIMQIQQETLEKLLLEVPQLERYFKNIYQRAYAASLLRVKYLFTMSKEKFYDYFSSKYPEFIQRIPQKILASFLGFTPEYLSELRKKKHTERSKIL